MDIVLSWYTLLLLVSGLSATPAGQTHSRAKRGSLNIITLGTLEKQALVDAHNFYRAAVSPTATNMIKMVSRIPFKEKLKHDLNGKILFEIYRLGKTSKCITAGCNQMAAAFNSFV